MNSFGIRRRQHISWTPEQYIKSGGIIHAWFDASQRSTITTEITSSVEYVSRWNSVIDGSTKYVSQTNAARRPIYMEVSPYNKRACVYFDHGTSDTASDFMAASSVLGGNWQTGSYPISFVCAARCTGLSIRPTTGDTTENAMMIFGWEGQHVGIATLHAADGKQTGVATVWWNAAFGAQRSVSDSAQQNTIMNFYGAVTGTPSTTSSCQITNGQYNKLVSSTEQIGRGKYSANVNSMGTATRISNVYAWPLKGEIYELFMMTGLMPDYTRIKALEYLRSKWGV